MGIRDTPCPSGSDFATYSPNAGAGRPNPIERMTSPTPSTINPPLFLSLFDIGPKSSPSTPTHESPVLLNVRLPQLSPVIGASTSPSSPEGEIFYDALESFEDTRPLSSDTPTSTGGWQSPINLVEPGSTQNGYGTVPTFAATEIILGLSAKPPSSDTPTSTSIHQSPTDLIEFGDSQSGFSPKAIFTTAGISLGLSAKPQLLDAPT
ncbi:unnamed protein product, partial [Rhizoctonia solani]